MILLHFNPRYDRRIIINDRAGVWGQFNEIPLNPNALKAVKGIANLHDKNVELMISVRNSQIFCL